MGQDLSQLKQMGAFHQLLEYCSWEQRIQLLSLNRTYRQQFHRENIWKLFCLFLGSQDYIHVVHFDEETWKDTFARHAPLRKRWLPLHLSSERNEESRISSITDGHNLSSNENEGFHISVCARFRPLPKYTDEKCTSNENGAMCSEDMLKTVIPLHQRIRMIRANYDCSSSEALKILWAGKSAEGPHDPWKTAVISQKVERIPLRTVKDGENVPISVITESTHTCKDVAKSSSKLNDKGSQRDASNKEDPDFFDSAQEAHALPPAVRTGVLAVRPQSRDLLICAAGGLKQFTFNHVLPDTCDQGQLYNAAARLQVSEFLNGVNACIICYGQTGSGKTFSMFGPDDLASTCVSRVSPHAGIAPRAITDVVNTVLDRRENGLDVTLRLSCVEIFGQDVTDLLHDRSVVGAWHGVAARAVLSGDASEEIVNPFDLDELLLRAERSKRRAATAMNERSSRAHTLLLMTLDQKNRKTGVELHSVLCFADLGGSEQLKKSKAEGERKEEAAKINLGLLALKRCITTLQKDSPDHVPFQDSTLTLLLRPALTGNSHTTVVVTGSMEPRHAVETLQTMRFGEACQAVTGSAVTANVNMATHAIDAINDEIKELEERIQQEERWVTRTTVREDLEGHETVVTTALEGAEELRQRFEQLLETRHQLLGL